MINTPYMKDKSILRDDRELEFPHVFVLNASAGSGKTHNLSLRFVQFLLSNSIKNNFLENILAITFTNKAANEMKERILRLLKMVALSKDSKNRDYLKALNDVSPLVHADHGTLSNNAYQYVDRIIKNYTDFQIKTIDSFLRTIISAHLMETGIMPGFEISMDSRPYVEYALNELLEQIDVPHGTRKLFDEFLDTYLHVEQRKGFYPAGDIVTMLISLRGYERTSGVGIVRSNGSSPYAGKLNQMLQSIVHDAISLQSMLSNETRFHAHFSDALHKLMDNKPDFSSGYWLKHDVNDLLLKNDLTKEQLSHLQKQWDRIRKKLQEIITHSMTGRLASYIDIFSRAENLIDAKTLKENVLFIDDLNAAVRKLIDQHTVPELYFKLGETIYHYLVDEFQDTDRAQWQNIKELVANSLSKGGSLFYVGDRKQAIYRFKGGDPQLFDEVSMDFGNYCTLYKESLNENYRSSKVLTDFFNNTFKPDNLQVFAENRDGRLDCEIRKRILEHLKNTYSGAEQNTTVITDAGKGGYVYIEYVMAGPDNRDKAGDGSESDTPKKKIRKENAYSACIDKTMKLIIEQHESYNYDYKDMAVLVRTNDDAMDVTTGLKASGIPVESERTTDVRQHPLIAEVISFLKFLNAPLDDLSFAAFITGDIFTKASAVPAPDVYNWLFLTMEQRRKHKQMHVYKLLQQWKPDLWEQYIKELFSRIGYLPPYDLVYLFLNRMNVQENFPDAEGFFMHLLELIKQREAEGENNLDSFLKYFLDPSNNDDDFLVHLSSDQNAVHVLTIHKAKGLEFPVVILPFAVMNAAGGSQNQLIVKHTEPSGDFTKIVYYKSDYIKLLYDLDNDSEYVQAYINKMANDFIDELNVFYVAVTRAKHKLFILLPQNESDNPLLKLFGRKETDLPAEPGEYVEYGRQEYVSSTFKPEKKQTVIEAVPVTDWQKHIYGITERQDVMGIISVEQRDAIRRGEMIHGILSGIQYIDKDIHTFVEELVRRAYVPDLYKDIISRDELADTLKGILTMDKVKPWFVREHALQVFSEKEVADADGELKRMDRLVITPKHAIVIDFKTGAPRRSHNQQVKSYMRYIRDIYMDKQARGCLLYLDLKRVVEVV